MNMNKTVTDDLPHLLQDFYQLGFLVRGHSSKYRPPYTYLEKQDVLWNTNAPIGGKFQKGAIIIKTQDKSQDVKI
jgi:hypothetical protein